MKWEKLGRIYDPQRYFSNGYTHGTNPFPVPLSKDLVRIFFNRRDCENRSHITFLDFDMTRAQIAYVHDGSLVGPGEPGLFDDSGCSLGSIVDMPSGEKYIYYMGWNLCVTVPWRNYIGLAVLGTDGNCRKFTNVPILERNVIDPLSLSYPYVMHDEGRYKMWYGSHLKWGPQQKDMVHVIKYAESGDGIHWDRNGVICIQGKDDREHAFSKASVWKNKGIYKMCYCYRGTAYRIGYAESPDGITWTRTDDQAGIDISPTGWDSEMVAYPAVFTFRGERYMLYCGNAYGLTGFGLARCIEE